MIARLFFDRLIRKPVPRLRLSRPGQFLLIRGAPQERIDAEYDAEGRRMLRLIVHTRSR